MIRNAILRPCRTIVENAGEEGSVVVGKLLSEEYTTQDKFNWGYDAATSQYRDMIAAGILDPLKVVRTALVDASGVASLLTTSECCVVDAEEKGAPPGMGMGGGMPGMGGMGGMM
jgi:chaperonin GroEL